jgi:hypothetical protein
MSYESNNYGAQRPGIAQCEQLIGQGLLARTRQSTQFSFQVAPQ